MGGGARRRRHSERETAGKHFGIHWNDPIGGVTGIQNTPIWLAVVTVVGVTALTAIAITLLVALTTVPGIAHSMLSEARAMADSYVDVALPDMIQEQGAALIDQALDAAPRLNQLSPDAKFALLAWGLQKIDPELMQDMLPPALPSPSPRASDEIPQRYHCPSTDTTECTAIRHTCETFAVCRGEPSMRTCLPFARNANHACDLLDCSLFVHDKKSQCYGLEDLCATRVNCMSHVRECIPLASNMTRFCRSMLD